MREIRPILPPSAQVRTGAAEAQHATSNTNGFLSIIQDFLLAFAGVALFVGRFVIANTLSITIAQRTRELATLRTLGATRRQVLRSVLLEAFLIGLLASVVGLFLGLGARQGPELAVRVLRHRPAAGEHGLRDAHDRRLAGSSASLITVLAALRPALRATRVPPIAAVREGAVLPPSRFARFGTPVAVLTILGAVALMLIGSVRRRALDGIATARDRRGRGGAVRGRGDARQGARAAARVRARLARDETRRAPPAGSRAATRCATPRGPPRPRRR